MSRRPDGWIGWTTTGCVALLAVIAGTVSYLHMHQLVAGHGQPGWLAALTPLSVDGMIVAASTALLADSRSGGRGGLLPWALLVTADSSVASLAANVAVAEPTATGRVIAAWPSFALIGSYELLMRQMRSAPGSARASNPAARHRRVAGDATSARPQSSVSRQGRATPGVTGSEAGEVGSCSCRPGSGRGPTRPATARFRPVRPSPASMVGASAGVGSSNRLDWRAHSPPTSKPHSNAQTLGPVT